MSGIQSACADLSFSLDARDRLVVTMHFSFMVGQPRRDLLLAFSGPISIRWEQESFGLNPLPTPLPRIEGGRHPAWTFPLLQIEDSSWLIAHESNNPPAAARRAHFALVSLNDLVQILALPEVAAEWIDAPLNT